MDFNHESVHTKAVEIRCAGCRPYFLSIGHVGNLVRREVEHVGCGHQGDIVAPCDEVISAPRVADTAGSVRGRDGCHVA